MQLNENTTFSTFRYPQDAQDDPKGDLQLVVIPCDCNTVKLCNIQLCEGKFCV